MGKKFKKPTKDIKRCPFCGGSFRLEYFTTSKVSIIHYIENKESPCILEWNNLICHKEWAIWMLNRRSKRGQ